MQNKKTNSGRSYDPALISSRESKRLTEWYGKGASWVNCEQEGRQDRQNCLSQKSFTIASRRKVYFASVFLSSDCPLSVAGLNVRNPVCPRRHAAPFATQVLCSLILLALVVHSKLHSNTDQHTQQQKPWVMINPLQRRTTLQPNGMAQP